VLKYDQKYYDVIVMSLVKMLEFYNNYIKDKQFSADKLNGVLADCLFRYIDAMENDNPKEKLIDCIKQFNRSGLDDRFNEIKQIININDLSETNRLLLIKSVYYENKYKITDQDRMKTESPC
jgi:hypothetical protein